jgi:hypothetical protein
LEEAPTAVSSQLPTLLLLLALIAFLFLRIRKVHGVSTGLYTIAVNIQGSPTMPEVRSHKARALRFSLFEKHFTATISTTAMVSGDTFIIALER